MIYSHEKLIEKGQGAFGKEYNLVHVPDCEEVAGAGIRQIKECYRVVYTIGGTRHSKAYKTLDEAQKTFDSITKPILAQQ